MILATLPPIPAPDPVPQPAPSWLLWSLLLLTFLLHLLAMNLVLGGSVIAAFNRRRARQGDRPHHRRLADWLTHAMPIAMAATITLGVAPLLFLQVLYGRLFYTSSVLLGWIWFAVVPLVMVAYYGTYLLAFKGERLGAWEGAVRWLTVVLFMAIAFIFSNNMSLMLRPEVYRELYAAGGPALNMGDATLWPRYGHMILAALAVAGMWVAGYGLATVRRDPAFGDWAMRHGAAWFSAVTGVNLLFGFWFLFSLPPATMARFMGEVPAATALLATGMALGIGSLALMFMAVHAPRPAPLVRMGLAALSLTLVSMVLMRDQVRRGALAAMGYEPVKWISPQWGNIAVFVGLLLAGAVAVVWMIRALVKGSAAQTASPEVGHHN